MAVKNARRQIAYGYPSPQFGIFPSPLVIERDPLVTDKGDVGQIWVNPLTNNYWILTSYTGGDAIWTSISSGAASFSSLTVNPGPINLTGTTTVIGTTLIRGTTGINITAGAATTIGTGGTGIVNIGNATGNTFVTGSLNATTGLSTTNGSISAGNTAASASSSNLQILKSRTGGVITTGDDLGNLIFAGYDGTGYTTGAAIVSTSSGTIAATRVAGNLKFYTHPDAPAGTPTLRMTIGTAGNVVVATPDAGSALVVSGGGVLVSAGGVTLTQDDVTITDGDLVLSAPTTRIQLPGPVNISTGAGAPAGGLAINVGDLYINTTAVTAITRLYICDAPGSWATFTASA